MWELGNFWTERLNSAPVASIHTMMHEIHVLLVDHDAEALNIAKQLEMWQYKGSYILFFPIYLINSLRDHIKS